MCRRHSSPSTSVRLSLAGAQPRRELGEVIDDDVMSRVRLRIRRSCGPPFLRPPDERGLEPDGLGRIESKLWHATMQQASGSS